MKRDRGREPQGATVLAGGDQAHIRQARLFLVWLVDWRRLRRVGETLAAPTEGLDYLESFLLGAVELRLPPHVFALFGLSVGHPDPARPAGVKPRLPQEAVVFGETYDQAHAGPPLAAYDERLCLFQREQAMTERSWTEQATQRVRDPESLSGRDRLRDELGALGFALR